MINSELSVKSENVQVLYSMFEGGGLYVNRRYQRKLVWTIEEKQAFIDSLANGYPVPILLLAEAKKDGKDIFEILDGMQRLNAITSFIENDFDLNGYYFDLNTMIKTKELLDNKILTQKEPILDRKICSLIASYPVPVSIYSFSDDAKIDDIFRRINSNGRYLSKQELRSAGATGSFPNLVRKIAAEIRGDSSPFDVLPLNKMKLISINNKKLDYGIDADNIFWVRHGIILKSGLRESKDEEIVADSFAYMSLSETQRSNPDVLDQLYGYSKSKERHEEIETALKQTDPELLSKQYVYTHDFINEILDSTGQVFVQYVLASEVEYATRYYTVFFLSLYDLLFRENLEVKNRAGLLRSLQGLGKHMNISTGGNWSAINRTNNIDAVKGILRKSFKKKNSIDPMTSNWVTEFLTILTHSKIEQTLYDFKQGFYSLDGKTKFNNTSFKKIIKTLSAMANHGPDVSGYVCIGVADSLSDAEKVSEIHQIDYESYNNFFITGVNHEISLENISAEDWLKKILSLIDNEPISESLKMNIKKNVRLITYRGKHILILSVRNVGEACSYDDKYYYRAGPAVKQIKPAQYPSFFKKF
ncbi:TPA: DUF262 domain-containing protein [Serratia marcescens]|uniref:GmrSD restriction endonuclease domain-containing protein n=1 Tax=Serratia marcescens TaxID=615 RepID=UPI002178C8A7|nr:DUF262 domain-containing protein [Serratia marcescens]CAI1659861.1 Uncharacterized conserved protein [Serratia marcescens]HCR2982777.1 DUF262 domain-containing protein [Serratia marcescens]HCR2988810.1 DUF262 domain-containing protein [Serratia marcescens]HCR3012752.1 DUF262 domain-containing protein [Serratia marcescens]